MIIDLTDLFTGSCEEIFVKDSVSIPLDNLSNTSIRSLNDVYFDGSVVRLSDSDFQLAGILSGVMVLPDDITLEDVNYSFKIDILEDFNLDGNNNLEIVQNNLDITEFLWQNILVEVPLKVKKPENEGLTLKGDGWRLISEDEVNVNNSPLSDLSKMFDSGKE